MKGWPQGTPPASSNSNSSNNYGSGGRRPGAPSGIPFRADGPPVGRQSLPPSRQPSVGGLSSAPPGAAATRSPPADFTSPPLSPRSSGMMLGPTGQGPPGPPFSPPMGARGGSGGGPRDSRWSSQRPLGGGGGGGGGGGEYTAYNAPYGHHNDYNDDSPFPNSSSEASPRRLPSSSSSSFSNEGGGGGRGGGGGGAPTAFPPGGDRDALYLLDKEKKAKPDRDLSSGDVSMTTGGLSQPRAAASAAAPPVELFMPEGAEEGLLGGDGMVYISRIIQEKDSFKKRVGELESDLQLCRLERGSFIEQINKQFKEEEKLMASIQSMKNELEELRTGYTQLAAKLQDSRSPSDIVEMMREENTILKERLKSVETHGGSDLVAAVGGGGGGGGGGRAPTIYASDKTTDAESKLKRAMEEKKMLLLALNESMNNASRLERENAQLQEAENRLRSGTDERSTPESIIRQIELNGSSVLMYTCTRLQDKIAILDAAIATHSPNVIMTVILYLRDTLSQQHLFEILADAKHAPALHQYRHLLTQCGYESELHQLYHFLGWSQKEGMFMLRQAFRIKNPTERMNALLLCTDFFSKHEALQWYGEQLQQKVNSLAYLQHPEGSQPPRGGPPLRD